jgi:hypothetical protein
MGFRVWEYTRGAHHIGILPLRWLRQCSSQSSPPSDYLKQRKQHCTEADVEWGRLLTCGPGDELSATISVNVVGSVSFPFRQLTSTYRTSFANGTPQGVNDEITIVFCVENDALEITYVVSHFFRNLRSSDLFKAAEKFL